MNSSYKKLKENFISKIEKELKESGANLNRIIYHIEKDDVAFLTAFRSIFSKKQNKRRNHSLENDIKSLRLSFVKVGGGYLEDGQEVIEDSYMVIRSNPNISKDIFFKAMIGLCRKYDQDSVLISIVNNDKKRRTSYYNKDGQAVGENFSSLSLTDVNLYFSKIHGHKFKLKEDNIILIEDVEYKFNGSSDACLFYSHLEHLLK